MLGRVSLWLLWLQAAQQMQEKLQAQQAELAARLQRAEASPAGAGHASGRSDWPLLTLLAASMVGNVLLWRRRALRPGK